MIQWRKFELKKNSRNEVINFFRIFYDFSGIFRVKIFVKRGLLVRDPCGSDVDTWRRLCGAKDQSGYLYWAHGYSGPRKEDRGAY